MTGGARCPQRTDRAGLALNALRTPRSSCVARVTVALVVLLTLAYYFWTAVCSFPEVPRIRPRGYPETDHFNLLSRGFLRGELSLGDAPPELVAAPNPYDPQSRGPIEVLHDASYYRGKYYIYFGPAPVVTLFLPFTVLTGRDLPLPYAVWLFSSGAFLALTAAFLFLQRRHFPGASTWTLAASLLALGAGSMIVALLRRPHIWELAGSAGLFYFALAMFCLVRALHSGRAVRWAIAGGLALGLAVASRPTYILCSVVFALPLLVRARARSPATPVGGEVGARPESPQATPAPGVYSWRALVGAAAGCGAIVLGLFAYNYARFNDPFEFGQKYQLSSIVEGDAQHFSLSYVWFNFRVYFLSALQWTEVFPFHNGVPVPARPAGHGGYEHAIGILPNLPFCGLSLVALTALALPSWRRGFAPELHRAIASIAAAALIHTSVLLGFFGVCVRYEADFTPWFMLLAALGLLIGEAKMRPAVARGLLRALAAGLALFSAASAGLSLVNAYNHSLEVLMPGYPPVARVLNYPTYLLYRQHWGNYEPRELVLTFPPDRTPRREVLATLTRGERRTAEVFVEYFAEGDVRFGYRELASGRLFFTPTVMPRAETRHTLKIGLGGPPAEYDGQWFRLRMQFDDRPLCDALEVSLHAFPGRFGVPEAGPDCFTGVVHAARAIAAGDFTRPFPGGVRLRVMLTPGMEGRAFPVVVGGRPEAGDFLFLRVSRDRRVSFGYDHWGAPGVSSPEFAVSFDTWHVVECWLPAVTSPRGDESPSELIVKLDGAEVWRATLPHFPTRAETFFVGRNPIGGTSCEAHFDMVIVDETQLPPPPGEN